jgi:hypothetical protein
VGTETGFIILFDPLAVIKSAIHKAQAIQPNAAMSCVLGEVVSVSDPENKGRCKVRLQNFTAQDNAVSYATDWSETTTNRINKGRLPETLLGKLVLVFPVMQSYETVAVNISGSLVYNSTETLPEPCLENLGAQVIRLSAQEAFCSVCLLRNGQYKWVDTCDLKHGHATGDTQDQDNDTGGDFQSPVEQGVIHDSVFSTVTTPYEIESGFTPPILR